MIGRRASGVGNPEITDSERRHAAHVMRGTVRQVRYTNPPAVRVAIGDEDDDDGHLLTGWLPMAGGRAGGDSDWHPLEVGEGVVVLSESGEAQNGVVIPAGFYSDDNPAPGDKAGLWRKRFRDGASIEYDRDSGAFLIDAKSSATLKVAESSVVISDGQIVLSVGGVSLTISSDGFAFEGGDLTHSGKNVGKDHRHLGVQAGSDQSGEPV
jgi:phage baseplate assembly protein V